MYRYRKENDYETWQDNLRILQLDLENLESIADFIQEVTKTLPHLDILINNAAQTIARPQDFYQALQNKEEKLKCLTSDCDIPNKNDNAGAILSRSNSYSSSWLNLDHFPLNEIDVHGQQVDKRPRNSWTYNLDEVPLKELLQVRK